MHLLFSQLEEITGGEILSFSSDMAVESLLTDSRKVSIRQGALFVAIKGDFHDGHDYIDKLYEDGIRQFLVESGDKTKYHHLTEANVIRTGNSLVALQKITAFHRSRFSIPIIGITGSNGKTIVKEWLSQMLSAKLRVVKSPKSYNSQLGVPLSVWQLSNQHQIGVFEAGISKSGEMDKIEIVLQPTIGVFTNIGSAHDKGFTSQDEKIHEKAKLFKNSQVVIYCRDHEAIHQVLSNQIRPPQKLFSWSEGQSADVFIKDSYDHENMTALEIEFNENRMFFKVPFHDPASLENVINCICVCLYLNFDRKLIQESLMGLSQVSMRLALKQGINGCYLIDDTYNNDLAGLKIALDFLTQQNQKAKKTLILSDILEAGPDKAELYEKVAALVASKSINRFVGIGPDLKRHARFFNDTGKFYVDKPSFFKATNLEDFRDEVVLIKGARLFALEEIVDFLQRKIHGTVMEINLDAITHNLNFYRNKLDASTKILVMIKAFAYGSGFLEIANLLQFHRVDYLGVAYPDEGVILRQNGISLPIMVMNPAPESFGKMIQFNLEPEVYSLKMTKLLAEFLRANNLSVKIHIKLETGMHRLGFAPEDLKALVTILKGYPEIKIASIFSHLAGSEDAEHDEFSQYQFKLFEEGVAFIEKLLSVRPLKHILKSSGIIRFPDRHYDMVRLGIGLHGIGYNDEVQEELEPVASLKTTISQIREVKKGDTIGYDRMGKADEPKKIATLAIGYADGFDRRFSNGNGVVWVNGKLAPVIGNVCMDMTMIDVTGIEAQEEDQVVVFGKELPLRKIASKIGTIPYEILTKVSGRVKRVFYIE